MKSPFLQLLAILLLFAAVFFSCKKSDSDNPAINYPIEISFENYSLEGASGQWTNLPYNDKVIVINSSEELKQYIICTDDNYPEIDFSKHTLVYVVGCAAPGMYQIEHKSLQLISTHNYEMRIELKKVANSGNGFWRAPILVNKIFDNISIELIVVVN
jgi:hypothetical protein